MKNILQKLLFITVFPVLEFIIGVIASAPFGIMANMQNSYRFTYYSLACFLLAFLITAIIRTILHKKK